MPPHVIATSNAGSPRALRSTPMPQPQTLTVLALGLVSAAAMLLELTLIRLLSVAFWYPFAYVALAVAMLGLGSGAMWIALSPRLRAADRGNRLSLFALAFAVAAVAGYVIWNAIPVAPLAAGEPWQLVWITLFVALLALPFLAVGLFTAHLFAMFPQFAARLYGVDLGGAALGTLICVVVLPLVGAPATVLLAGTLGLLASVACRPVRGVRSVAVLIVAAALIGAMPHWDQLVPLRITPNKLLGHLNPSQDAGPMIWTLGSAVSVLPTGRAAMIVIDAGTAMTLAPKGPEPGAAFPPPQGLRAIPYALRDRGSTLIIGSGGGREVQAALGAGSHPIVALEIDPAINRLVRGPLKEITGDTFFHPSVKLHTAEARSYLEALSPDVRFDFILSFHTISNAASMTGAMSLAENYLLTVEAMELLLGRLSPLGVLVVSRPERQMGRLAATLATAWQRRSNGDLRPHVAIASESRARPAFLSALVLSKRPLDDAALTRMAEVTRGRTIYTPRGGDRHDYFDAVLRNEVPSTDLEPMRSDAFLDPATDDKPFFNLMRPWDAIRPADLRAVFLAGRQARARLEDTPIAQVAVIVFLLVALAFGVLVSLPVLVALVRAGISAQSAATVGATFAALGLAYMLLEINLIQRFTRILGEPEWSITAVLSTLLLASGLGSMLLAGRCEWTPRRSCIAAAVAGAAAALLLPPFIELVASQPLSIRVVGTLGFVAPLGVAMGTPFAAIMRRLRPGPLVAWGWAQNALFSVCGSIVGLILASTLGMTAAALCATGGYLAAGAAWRAAARRSPRHPGVL